MAKTALQRGKPHPRKCPKCWHDDPNNRNMEFHGFRDWRCKRCDYDSDGLDFPIKNKVK